MASNGPIRRLTAQLFFGAALLCGVMVSSGIVMAQSAAAAPTRDEYERLFLITLKNPNDLDATFKFAQVAAQLDEDEAAIGALERLLFYNPNLSRVRLELGVLYYKLKAYGQARVYFAGAVEGEGVPEEVKARAQAFIQEIDRRDNPSQFSGYFQAGARYQSNVNAGPSSLNVRALGFDAVLNQQFGRRNDWNSFFLGGVRHVQTIENGRGDTLETTISGYLSRQNRNPEFDIGLVEITAGPRINLSPEQLPGVTFRPYGLLNVTSLGRTGYQTGTGYGAALSIPTQWVSFEAVGDTRRRAFDDSNKFPTASQQTGVLSTGTLSALVPVLDGLRFFGRVSYADNATIAAVAFNAYVQQSYELGMQWEFSVPFFDLPRRWTLTPTIGQYWTRYSVPNPLIDPAVARKDREFRTGISLDAPISENLGFGAQVLLQNNSSSLPNYRYHNWSVVMGPTLRF